MVGAGICCVLLLMLYTTDVSILSWNVRGGANASCKRNLKELVRRMKPDICFIFEPRAVCANDNVLASAGL